MGRIEWDHSNGPYQSRNVDERLIRSFVAANERRDYGIYKRFMDAALLAKARSIFPHFGSIHEGTVIVDAGSGTGQLAELAAREFRGSKVYALDISHELLEQAAKDSSLIELLYGDAAEQNFPNNSVDIKYYSTSGHEIETFGGTGSMKRAMENTFRELRPGGRAVIRDFVKPSRKDPLLMHFISNVGLKNIPANVRLEDLDYSLLSTEALFHRFHAEFNSGNAFQYEQVEKDSLRYFRLLPEWAYEFYMRKDYTANWRQEIKEKYSYWTLEDPLTILRALGYTNIRTIEEYNDFIIDNRLAGKVGLYEERNGVVQPIDLPPTHMTIVAEKPQQTTSTTIYPGTIESTDYSKTLETINIDREQGVVTIDDQIFEIEGEEILGTKKHIFRLKNKPGHVLKVVRQDTLNTHNVFKSMYQIIERQAVLDEYKTPHVRVISHDSQKPPYRYLIQEDVPAGSINAAMLIENGELTEEDIRQMASIINKYEKGKKWQLDTNPFSWFRVKREDGNTEMVYVSNKVYLYDETWEFRKKGLLQWLDPRYIQHAQNFSAAIPTNQAYEQLQEVWEQGGNYIDEWKKYLDEDVQP